MQKDPKEKDDLEFQENNPEEARIVPMRFAESDEDYLDDDSDAWDFEDNERFD